MIHGNETVCVTRVSNNEYLNVSVSNSATTREDGSFAMRLLNAGYVLRMYRYTPGGSEVWFRDLEVPPRSPPVYVMPGGAVLTTGLTNPVGRPVSGRARLYPGRGLTMGGIIPKPVRVAKLRAMLMQPQDRPMEDGGT